MLFAGWTIIGYIMRTLRWGDALTVFGLACLTMIRVLVLVHIALASLIWVPIGVCPGATVLGSYGQKRRFTLIIKVRGSPGVVRVSEAVGK